MKKVFITIIVAIIIFCEAGLIISATAPNVSATSAVLIEKSTGVVLCEKNADQRRPPASTTKIMTALIAIENAELDQMCKVSKQSSSVDGSQLGLLTGDEISLKDLLYMLLLKSANDAAEAIAENVAGSIEAFAEMMNEKAREIGCKDTNFVNPHGLPDDNHYTTAKDLAMIARVAMNNPIFTEIVSSKSKTLDYFRVTISNSNKLLSYNNIFTGIKTGFTKKAGRCLVSSAKKDNVELIAVTLNAGDDWNDHVKLMNYGFERVEAFELLEACEYSATRPVLNGITNAQLSNLSPLYGIKIDGKPLSYQYSENISPVLFAPISEYKAVGELCLMYNNYTVSKAILYCIDGVEEVAIKQNLLTEFIQNFENLFRKVLY